MYVSMVREVRREVAGVWVSGAAPRRGVCGSTRTQERRRPSQRAAQANKTPTPFKVRPAPPHTSRQMHRAPCLRRSSSGPPCSSSGPRPRLAQQRQRQRSATAAAMHRQQQRQQQQAPASAPAAALGRSGAADTEGADDSIDAAAYNSRWDAVRRRLFCAAAPAVARPPTLLCCPSHTTPTVPCTRDQQTPVATPSPAL